MYFVVIQNPGSGETLAEMETAIRETIAEFAENDEIIKVLRNLGVDYAQGYGVESPQRISKIAVNG
jgi:EAL domain-containing protein (putative c-di-GMP-specific phosphodiesterase class I)